MLAGAGSRVCGSISNLMAKPDLILNPRKCTATPNRDHLLQHESATVAYAYPWSEEVYIKGSGEGSSVGGGASGCFGGL